MNITGFFSCSRGSSFGNESQIAWTTRSREKTLDRRRGGGGISGATEIADIYLPPSLIRARLSFTTLTPGSPKKPSQRPSVFSWISVSHGRERQVPDGGDPGSLQLRVGERDIRVDARRRGRHCVDRNLVDRQTWVVRRLELQHGLRVRGDELRERGVRRAEVRERRARRVVGGRSRRRPLVERRRRREELRRERRADDPAVVVDQAAVRLRRESELGRSRSSAPDRRGRTRA